MDKRNVLSRETTKSWGEKWKWHSQNYDYDTGKLEKDIMSPGKLNVPVLETHFHKQFYSGDALYPLNVWTQHKNQIFFFNFVILQLQIQKNIERYNFLSVFWFFGQIPEMTIVLFNLPLFIMKLLLRYVQLVPVCTETAHCSSNLHWCSNCSVFIMKLLFR